MQKYLIVILMLIAPQVIFAQIMNVHKSDGTLDQINIADIDSITFSSVVGEMTWLGHASIKIKTNDGFVIYIDPYAGSDYSEPADLILVTHGHSDHTQANKVTKKDGCLIYSGPSASVGGTTIAPGEQVDVSGLAITAVHAYNSNHPKGNGVGFVLDFGELKFYHSGDTGKIDEMAELTAMHLDYALLCIDGVYNMGPDDAMQAAEVIQAKKVIPIHVAPSNASETDKQKNINKFNPPNKLILKEGDTIYL